MSASPPLLTIIVPTYNRAHNLAVLLRTLAEEVQPLDGRIAVMVSDNASTDGTPEVVRAVRVDWPELVSIRRPVNLGAEGNFCECVELVDSRYFWIIGDDDLPKRGVAAKLLELLSGVAPALVYLQSDWIDKVIESSQGRPVERLEIDLVDAAVFARRVHIWLTFISGLVIDRDSLHHSLQGHTIRRFIGSSLVQLGWILPLLEGDRVFAVVNNSCVLATKDNSGGYPMLTVFGVRFANIADQVLGRKSLLARELVAGNLRYHLPSVVWQSRQGAKPGFEQEDPWDSMQAELRWSPWFWLLIYPIFRFPRLVAGPYYQTWRIVNRLRKSLEKRRLGSFISQRVDL